MINWINRNKKVYQYTNINARVYVILVTLIEEVFCILTGVMQLLSKCEVDGFSGGNWQPTKLMDIINS